MFKVIDANGNEIASVNMNKSQILKKLNPKTKKINYGKINSIDEENNGRHIVFNCDDNTKFYYDLADKKFYHENKTEISDRQLNEINKNCTSKPINHLKSLVNAEKLWLVKFFEVLEGYCNGWNGWLTQAKINSRHKLSHMVGNNIIVQIEKIAKIPDFQKLSLREIKTVVDSLTGLSNEEIKFVTTSDWYHSKNINNPTIYKCYLNACASGMKEFFEKAYDNYNFVYENFTRISELVTVYKYDIDRLLKYNHEDLLHQGLEPEAGYYACNILLDYAKMATKVYGNKFEKYPRYLKVAHDIASMNYKLKQDEITKKDFAKAMALYKNYDWKKDKFCIIVPKSADEIIEEGKKLHHCVASYVDRVIKNQCLIVFMREKEKEDEPMITVEIRNNKVVQARGLHNRKTTKEEEEWLAKYEDKIFNRKVNETIEEKTTQTSEA